MAVALVLRPTARIAIPMHLHLHRMSGYIVHVAALHQTSYDISLFIYGRPDIVALCRRQLTYSVRQLHHDTTSLNAKDSEYSDVQDVFSLSSNGCLTQPVLSLPRQR